MPSKLTVQLNIEVELVCRTVECLKPNVFGVRRCTQVPSFSSNLDSAFSFILEATSSNSFCNMRTFDGFWQRPHLPTAQGVPRVGYHDVLRLDVEVELVGVGEGDRGVHDRADEDLEVADVIRAAGGVDD